MKKIVNLLFAVILLMPAVSAQELNIASFNIRLDAGGDYNHQDGWGQRKEKLCDFLRFQDFDAFGAQEVTNPQLIDMMKRLPDYDYVGVGRDDGKDNGERSAVFFKKDRFKLLEGGTFWLSETPEKVSMGWDAVCRRVCSYAHLKDNKSKKDFWFFNTHLDHVGVVARREGVKLILQKIHEIAGDKANIVVTGDFNVDQWSEAYNTILASGVLKDCMKVASNSYIPGSTFNNWNLNNYSPSHIDHIFVSANTEVKTFGILNVGYWSGDVKDDEIIKANDAPKELSYVNRTFHPLSDHFPIASKICFSKSKK